MSGTNEENNGLSPTNETAEPSFDAIASALYKGDHAEVDRLMAATEAAKEDEKKDEKVEEAVKTEDKVEETKTEETPSKGETNSSEEEKKPEAAAAASTANDKPEDVEALKKELHQYKSDAGRVPHLQRRLSELERELRATKARDATNTSKGNASKPNPAEIELDPDIQKDIDELREIDPVLAKTMERIAKTAAATSKQQVDNAVTTLTQQEQEAEDFRFYTEQKSRLLQDIPQAEQIFASAEWKQWKEGLTPGRRQLAESGYADEVKQAIYAFAADMRALQPVVPPAAPAVQPKVETPEKTEVSEARQRKVEASAQVPNPSAKKAETFDEEQAFREIYTNLAKQNHLIS
jgi:hypothetical protein